MSGTLLARVQPIHRGTHDPTKAYETLDIVVNAAASIAYMAVKNVPAGTALTDTGYWEVMADVSAAVANANAAANNGIRTDVAQELTKTQQAQARANINAPSPIVATAEGESVAVFDASDMPLQGLRLFGKTTQAAEPTPDAPQELVSVGNGGIIEVNVGGNQLLTLSIPNGLPGIPVASGGNYTDANGQQWICDEIDLARGVYVQRNIRKRMQNLAQYSINNEGLSIGCDLSLIGRIVLDIGMCNVLTPVNINVQFASADSAFAVGYYGPLICIAGVKTIADLNAYLDTHVVIVQVALASPVETPLSAEKLAAYAAMHSNYPNTTVLNDAGAYMEVSYAADTKLYIDNKLAELSTAIANNI